MEDATLERERERERERGEGREGGIYEGVIIFVVSSYRNKHVRGEDNKHVNSTS